jgi:hypothetical protein
MVIEGNLFDSSKEFIVANSQKALISMCRAKKSADFSLIESFKLLEKWGALINLQKRILLKCKNLMEMLKEKHDAYVGRSIQKLTAGVYYKVLREEGIPLKLHDFEASVGLDIKEIKSGINQVNRLTVGNGSADDQEEQVSNTYYQQPSYQQPITSTWYTPVNNNFADNNIASVQSPGGFSYNDQETDTSSCSSQTIESPTAMVSEAIEGDRSNVTVAFFSAPAPNMVAPTMNMASHA